MNEKKLVQNFKSYINVSPKNNGEKNGALQELTPKLLKDEVVVGAAHNVVMLTPLSERDRGRYGSVFITNYKLSFVPLESSQNDECSQRNYLLGTYDVPLTAVCAVWLTDGGPMRSRRLLLPSSDVPKKVKGVQVVCKNMQMLTFSFANSAIGKGRTVAMALIHHAFPKRHDLLFAFEYKDHYYPTLPPGLNMFQSPSEWKREVERCESVHWRVTCVNGSSDGFMLSAADTLVVPQSVLDCDLVSTARHFRSGRVPIWVWSRAAGAALCRSGELAPTELAPTAESVYLEQVRRSHPKLKPPHVIYLCGNSFTGGGGPNVLPPLPALQTSYRKLIDLCTPTTLNEFWVQDSQYYSLLDSSRWLRYVSNCLMFADEAAEKLIDNVTVVLQEGDGVDYAAVVSSLTQLLVDPDSRSLTGFQSLIQKEWVALGHPFCDRLGLPRPGNPKDSKDPTYLQSQMAPVFLLFLDCVWQLQLQFPASFQFTETYLTTLWDSTHNHIFDTFLFNCPRDREVLRDKNFVRRPLWDWGEQFSDEDISLFYNPLYVSNKTPGKPVQKISSLRPLSSPAATQLWSQCYERWLPPLDARAAGDAQTHAAHRALRAQITRLENKLESLSIMSNRTSSVEPVQTTPPIVTRFYPFSRTRSDPSRTLDSMQVSLIDASQLLDSQSLLNAPD